MPSRLRDCKEDKRNTKCHTINNNMGQLENNFEIVEEKIKEYDDDLNKKETFDKEMSKLSQHFNGANECLSFNRCTKRIVKFRSM